MVAKDTGPKTDKPTEKITPDEILDLTGLFCPEPVYRTRIKMDEMGKNKVLEVLADDPAAEEDIKVLSRNMGYEILSIQKDGDTLHILIKA
ncbi:MAG: sulfurtransferase TusA family protein [Candidatus Ranarchaeia archaeon]